jgi:large subunit ribosomal protein L15
MQLHEIQPIHKEKTAKRVGRGGKRGTYSGRGQKGQKARAGHNIRPAIRDFIKQIPKLEGHRFEVAQKFEVSTNLRDIARKFKEGETVSPQTLLEKGLVRKINGRVPNVKILGTGILPFKVKFENVKMSKSVQEKMQ